MPLKAHHELPESSSTNKILNLFPQFIAVFGILIVVPIYQQYVMRSYLRRSDLIGLDLLRIFCSFSWFNISLQVVVRGVYHLNTLSLPLSETNLDNLTCSGSEGPPSAF